MQNIEKVSLSELSDNFFALRIPSEYDCLMASTRKSEIVTVLVEAAKQLISSNSPENKLQVVFSNRYRIWLFGDIVVQVEMILLFVVKLIRVLSDAVSSTTLTPSMFEKFILNQ